MVRGALISESATEIRIKVTIAGMSAESTYPKADILTINRNLPVVDDSKKDDATSEMMTTPSAAVVQFHKKRCLLVVAR